MPENHVSLLRATRLATIVMLAAIVLNASAASAQPPLRSAQTFAVLAGTAVTCTTSSVVTGDLGVWPGIAVTQTGCSLGTGTVHAGDGVAQQAYLDFISAYNNLRDTPPPCTTLIGTLPNQLAPGVYCIDATARTGMLTLNGNANAVWIFLVNGALTGTNFDVIMMNGGQPCNVYWWTKGAATMTTSNFQGTILAGAAITTTGGTFNGHALATAGATLTNTTAKVCTGGNAVPPDMDKCDDRDHHHHHHHHGDGHDDDDDDNDNDHHDKDHHDKDHHDKDKDHGKCNQGVGNGPEGCDPGNSNHSHPSNDERGGTPGNPGRKGGNR